MSSPEEIQQQIDQTRAELSSNVDRLTDKVSPSKVAGRQVDRIRGRGSALRDRVMGSSADGSGLRGAGDSLGSAAGNARDAVSSAPQTVQARAQGNPLAAGLVAFGVGMLIASLAPPSQAEQQLAAQAEAKAKELAEPAKQAGQEMVEDLKPAVQEAVEEVKSSAQDAAQQTAEHAKSASQDVQATAQQ